MKTKTIFKALALAMMMPAMLLTSACSNQDDIANTSYITGKGYALPVTVDVTREGDEGTTRTTYNESTRKLEFSAGDKLFVQGLAQQGLSHFAGTLNYVPSTGKFSGTIYTENEWTGTAAALFSSAFSINAYLLPAGYESYGYLRISNNDSFGTNTNYTLATSKATAVEQFSYENVGGKGHLTDLVEDGEKAFVAVKVYYSVAVVPDLGDRCFQQSVSEHKPGSLPGLSTRLAKGLPAVA